MAFTYNANPFAVPVTPAGLLDTVRFLIGDTDIDAPQLEDTEVEGLLTENVSNPYLAAMEACTVLSARYTRKANKSVGQLSISQGAIAKQYADLRSTIATQMQRHVIPTPYAGGISKSDADIDNGDDDLNRSEFSVHMTDNHPATFIGEVL